MRPTLPLLLAFAGFGSALTIDLGNLDQYQTDESPPDRVFADAFWLEEADGGIYMAFGDDVQAKVKEVLGSCGEMDLECFERTRSALAESYFHVEGSLDGDGLHGRWALGAAQALAAGAALLMSLWVGNRLSHEDEMMMMSLQEAKLAEFEAFGSEDISVVADGQPVVSIPATPLESPTLQGSNEPTVIVAEDGSVSYDLGNDLCTRIPGIIMRNVNCRDGVDGDTGRALCGAEGVIRNTAPGGALNDLLLIDTEGLGLEVKESAGAAYEASLSILDFVDQYSYQLQVKEIDAEQLGMLILAMALYIVGQNMQDMCGRIALDMRLFTNTRTGTETETGDVDERCPDALVCGLEGEDCSLVLTGSEETPTVCGPGEYVGCSCDAPPLTFPNEETSYFLTMLSDLIDRVTGDPGTGTSPECEGDGVTEIPRDVFSGEDSSVHGKFCESWDKGSELSMTTDPWGESMRRFLRNRFLRGRAPPADASAYEGFSFELGFQPSGDDSDCKDDCNAAFVTMKAACSSPGGQGQMRESGEYDVGCGVFTYKILPREESSGGEGGSEEEEEEEEDEPTELYDPVAYQGLSALREDWQCVYNEFQFLGETGRWCDCRMSCDEEGVACDTMVINQEHEDYGCLRSTGTAGNEKCSACEPWKFACVKRCGRDSWDDCPDCHPL